MALSDMYNFERELAFEEELEQEWQEQEAEYYASLDEVSSFILDRTEYLVYEGIAGRSLYLKADEVAFMKALMQTLPHEQLENIKVHSLMRTPLEWVADDLLQQVPTAENQEAIIKNEPIALLLDEFVSHKKGRRYFVRAQLRNRFDAQDNDIQVGIFRAFLQGNKNDRSWCYNKALTWWDDGNIPDMEKVWETYKEPNCARVVSERFPLGYVKQHQEELGQADYHNLCLRLGREMDFAIDRKRLEAWAFFNVLIHCNRNISDAEADCAVFEFLAEALTSGHYPHHYSMKGEKSLYRPEEIPEDYRPSLLFIRGMGYVVWCLGQLGKSKTIMKLYSWNKQLQWQMPKYLATEGIERPQNPLFLFSSNEDYLNKNWAVFQIHAILTFPMKNARIEAYKEDIRKRLKEKQLPVEEEMEKMTNGESPVFQLFDTNVNYYVLKDEFEEAQFKGDITL